MITHWMIDDTELFKQSLLSLNLINDKSDDSISECLDKVVNNNFIGSGSFSMVYPLGKSDLVLKRVEDDESYHAYYKAVDNIHRMDIPNSIKRHFPSFRGYYYDKELDEHYYIIEKLDHQWIYSTDEADNLGGELDYTLWYGIFKETFDEALLLLNEQYEIARNDIHDIQWDMRETNVMMRRSYNMDIVFVITDPWYI